MAFNFILKKWRTGFKNNTKYFEKKIIMYRLPEKVLFCKKCVYSNIKPTSIPEWTHNIKRTGAKYLKIENDGICSACKNIEIKNKIDWQEEKKDY